MNARREIGELIAETLAADPAFVYVCPYLDAILVAGVTWVYCRDLGWHEPGGHNLVEFWPVPQ